MALEQPVQNAARAPAPPLPDAERARGRRLAISSHLAGMTFWTAFTDHLPTLALVSLGASETVVGVQSGLRPGSQLLQLPTLRAVAWVSKRRILVAGQALAQIGALPLVVFGGVAALGGSAAVALALASLAVTAVGLSVSNAVWFPLLRGYVEADRIGRFFGTIRTAWHLALILYFAGAQLWLARNDGAFGPLFGIAWGLGVLRIAMIARLPERSERTGERIRVREAFALVRERPLLRRYLVGVTWCGAVRHSVLPFAIVMMRREVGFSNAEVVYTTVALFTGGLVSLYPWGSAVDRLGPEPVFRWAAIGMGALYLALLAVSEPGGAALLVMVGFFFVHAILAAGHGVADTRVLFELTPPEAPARTLVLATVVVSVITGASPIVVGLALDRLLATAAAPLAVYHGFFALAALAQALSFLPLRVFRRPAQG